MKLKCVVPVWLVFKILNLMSKINDEFCYLCILYSGYISENNGSITTIPSRGVLF